MHFVCCALIALTVGFAAPAVSRAQALPTHDDSTAAAASEAQLGRKAADRGEFGPARTHFERSRELRLALYGPASAHVIESDFDLGILARRRGDVAEARRRLESARDTARRPGLSSEKDRATIDLALSNVLADLGETREAGALLSGILPYRLRTDGPDGLETARLYNNLGVLAADTGNTAAATEWHAKALAARTAKRDTTGIAESYANLVRAGIAGGVIDSAVVWATRAVDLTRRNQPWNDAAIARRNDVLSRAYLVTGDSMSAVVAAVRSEGAGLAALSAAATGGSEEEALVYAAARPSARSRLIDLASRVSESTARRMALDEVVFGRAMVFDELATRRRLAATGGDSTRALARDLQAASSDIWRIRLSTRNATGAAESMRRAIDRYSALERALAERTTIVSRRDQLHTTSSRAVIAALAPGEVLLSFVRYVANQDPRSTDGGERSDTWLAPETELLRGRRPSEIPTGPRPTPSYAVFVLRAGARNPLLIPLGRASHIDTLVTRWWREASRPPVNPFTREDDEARCQDAARTLTAAIWDPLPDFVHSAKRVDWVAEDALLRVQPAALVTDRGEYLADVGPLFVPLGAERDLVLADTTRGRGFCAFGDPAFDVAPPPVPPESTLVAQRGASSQCRELMNVRFPPLPATRREVNAAVKLWNRSRTPHAEVTTGVYATETAFRSAAPGHRYLHLATHGFFLDDDCGVEMGPPGAVSPFQLSGIAFASANRRAGREDDDGILSASEVSTLDLSGVECTVLSTCESGLGAVAGSEGWIGLERAFRIAGSRTLVASLWAVEDQDAEDWMAEWYKATLTKGLAPAEAAREAQRRRLAALRAQHRSTHPSSWAAFLASGAEPRASATKP